MDNGFVLLIEKEAMWAEMLQQVLKDNEIPSIAVPVYGAGLTIRAGVKERLRVYVLAESRFKATELLHSLFSLDEIP